MKGNTLGDLVEHFTCQIESLKLKVELRDVDDQDGACHSLMSTIQQELIGLSAVVTLIRNQADKQKEQLKTSEILKESVLDLILRLRYALDNIPVRLPKKQEPSPPQVSQIQVESRQEVRCQPVTKPMPQVKSKPAFYVQQVDLLTVDEFESAPKYMRGRLTYDQVNNTVEELNKALTAKYKLLAQKRNKLSDANRKKWEEFKTQQNKDSAGYYFIVDADIKAYSSLKIDSAFRAMMTILRHCGRLKEIRGGGITRYAVLLVY